MLEIKSYNYVYDDKTIFKNANTTFVGGNIIGLVGENGSGKTTFLLSLVGVNNPNYAIITYNKEPISDNLYYQRHSVYLSDEIIETNKSSHDYLVGLSKIYSKTINWNIYDKLSEKLEFDPNEIIKRMPKGKRRVAFIASRLALQPEVIILDEYLDGLDIRSSNIIRDFLIDYKNTYNAIIIISSHSTDDIKDFCDYLVFIDSMIMTQPISLKDVVNKYATYLVVDDQVTNRDFFIKKGIFVKDFQHINNKTYITIENDDAMIQRLNDLNLSQVKRIQETIEEAVYHELTS